MAAIYQPGETIEIGRPRRGAQIIGGGNPRLTVTIDNTGNSSALTDYQVKVTVTFRAGMQADFDDIRFVDTDGVTQLNYWLESKTDSTSAVFWVKVPSIGASSTKTIYITYGNAALASASNGTNTFEFFDDFDAANNLPAISNIDNLLFVSSEVITTGNRGFSSLLFDTDGHLVVHNTNKTWLYTNNQDVDGITWRTYVREFNLDTHAVDTESVAKDVDSGRSWSNGHLVLQLSPSLYVMYYTSNVESGTRTVRAATCSTPNGTFTRDTGFEITPGSQSWENILEVWPGWVKLSEDANTVTGYLGYASFDSGSQPNRLMGWAQVSVNKSTGATTLVGKKSTNPMSHLRLSGSTPAYNGGNIDSSILINGHYPIFYYGSSPLAIAYAESTSPTHEPTDLVQKKVFQAAIGSFDEIFSMYVWNGKVHLIMEAFNGSTWQTILATYLPLSAAWVNDNQSGATISATNGVLALTSGDTSNDSKDARMRSVASWTGNVALRARSKGAMVASQLNAYWGLGNSYRNGTVDDLAVVSFNIGNFYWANFHDGTGSGFSNTTFTNDAWYISDIAVLPTTTRFYLNNSYVGSKSTQLPVGNLNVRLEETQSGALSFDWVAVRKFAYPEPTANVA